MDYKFFCFEDYYEEDMLPMCNARMSKTKIWCCTKRNFVSKKKIWCCTKKCFISTKKMLMLHKKSISCRQNKMMLHKKIFCAQKVINIFQSGASYGSSIKRLVSVRFIFISVKYDVKILILFEFHIATSPYMPCWALSHDIRYICVGVSIDSTYK